MVIFRKKFKISKCLLSVTTEPNELKFGMWGFYDQPNNLRGQYEDFEKKFFLPLVETEPAENITLIMEPPEKKN